MRIGIFGGTFDPPHIGHLILAQEACDQLEIDLLLWVVTAASPLKEAEHISRVEDRIILVMAAIADENKFEISRLEIDRPGPYYAVDTVNLLRAQYPKDEIIYLMGGDSIENLGLWYCPADFIASCDKIGVMRRPGAKIDLDKLERKIPGIIEKVSFINAPLLEISASQIRERIRMGRPYRYYLLPKVYDIIDKNGLYKK